MNRINNMITLAIALGVSNGAMAAKMQPLSTPLSTEDARIADILITANEIDIAGGKIAKDKTVNPDVKSFAKEMVVDHSSAKKDVKKLLMQTGTKTKATEVSAALKQDAKMDQKKLRKLTSSNFDREYVEVEIKTHQKVLDTIDQDLLLKATDPELKNILTKSRMVVSQHLEHSKMLRDNLATKQ